MYFKIQKSLSSYCYLQSAKFCSNVKVHRLSQRVPYKIKAPKKTWYLQAEEEFLRQRRRIPDGYIGQWTHTDLLMLPENIRKCLKLSCASSKQISSWRKQRLRQNFQNSPFDTGSAPVQIACLTEKILNLRRHMLEKRKDLVKKKVMSILLSRRHKIMRYLYKKDINMYQTVCKKLHLRSPDYSTPGKPSSRTRTNMLAVDGNYCKFLIRQKLWKGRFRPMPVTIDGRQYAYTRHPIEKPSDGFNKPFKHADTMNSNWPFGVKLERIIGKYTIIDPTNPGKGHCAPQMLF